VKVLKTLGNQDKLCAEIGSEAVCTISSSDFRRSPSKIPLSIEQRRASEVRHPVVKADPGNAMHELAMHQEVYA